MHCHRNSNRNAHPGFVLGLNRSKKKHFAVVFPEFFGHHCSEPVSPDWPELPPPGAASAEAVGQVRFGCVGPGSAVQKKEKNEANPVSFTNSAVCCCCSVVL